MPPGSALDDLGAGAIPPHQTGPSGAEAALAAPPPQQQPTASLHADAALLLAALLLLSLASAAVSAFLGSGKPGGAALARRLRAWAAQRWAHVNEALRARKQPPPGRRPGERLARSPPPRSREPSPPPPRASLRDGDGLRFGREGSGPPPPQGLRQRSHGAGAALQFFSHQGQPRASPRRAAARGRAAAEQQQQQQQQEQHLLFSFRTPEADDDGCMPRRPSKQAVAAVRGAGAGAGAAANGAAHAEPGGGWDPELLSRCDEHLDEISSIEGLQRSPLYRGHVRSKGLTHEMATDHRLRVYKALRKADPEGFAALLSRRDVRDFEQRPPTRAAATAEPLISGILTAALLLAPCLSPYLAPLRPLAAAAWLAGALLAARAGAASAPGAALGVFLVGGQHRLPAGSFWAALAIALDAAFVAGTVGLGTLPNAAFRFATGQSVVERLLRLEPAVEESRATRLGPAPSPAAGGAARGGGVTPRRL
ncbi:hypothetical protein Rsub_02618 [Raphidocelis subcapitata]|uniref:Uncharacterized protein n=1 Tax=Raphidocelis subcapitata TaxID=307507 RepID=A0A2V0NQL0_9CHLO|nr:hypothetical protein Rsub_02618 [Raphidocelis subcapitata]|eukprot:GBF89914.1 hypothetical protein Rsub_02618 [Raphidocelis subcapitata]